MTFSIIIYVSVRLHLSPTHSFLKQENQLDFLLSKASEYSSFISNDLEELQAAMVRVFIDLHVHLVLDHKNPLIYLTLFHFFMRESFTFAFTLLQLITRPTRLVKKQKKPGSAKRKILKVAVKRKRKETVGRH